MFFVLLEHEFHSIWRINERRYISWHETSACKCRLDASVCNGRQPWNSDKCRCEWKKLFHEGRCDDRFTSGCKSDKSCDFGEYL